jgi:hypothetical protein
VPRDARVVARRQDRVRKVERCDWTREVWSPGESRRTSGTREPRFWPDPPAPCDERQVGCVREARRTETLSLEVSGRFTCDVPEAVWEQIAVGDRVEVPIGAVFGQPRCEGLRVTRG